MKFINKTKSLKSSAGFTLMEIMVATTVFVMVAVALLSLYNYVLKINRRGEALRQASQNVRNFVEFLVKEVRNGQIDYYVTNGLYGSYINNDSPQAPCRPPGNPTNAATVATYHSQSNWLGLINTDNVQECFYFAKADNSYVDAPVGTAPATFTAPAGSSYNLVMQKAGVSSVQRLNPPNARVENLMFLVRPLSDPYSSSTPSGIPKTQPGVVILIKFVVQLPTGEQVPVYYQTAVSENKYDIPNQ